MKFIPLPVSGRALRYNCTFRKLLATTLILAFFLPTLTLTVAAHDEPADVTFEPQHFVIYTNSKGELACRRATVLEANELEKIKPTNLSPINHLSAGSVKQQGIQATALPQHLTIILRATQALQNNAAANAAFVRAAAHWESLISSPVTIYIDADVGTTNFGQTWDANVIGSTRLANIVPGTYELVRNGLTATANTQAKFNVFNSLPVGDVPTDLGDAGAIGITAPIARALGILDPTAQPTDSAPRIAFNSNVTFDFDRTNGIAGGALDFEAVAIHEIGHALGFDSRAGVSATTPSPSVWDLYRFRSGTTAATFPTALRIATIGGPTTNSQYFFAPLPNEPERGLSDGGPDPPDDPPFPNNSDGNQSSHWRQAILNGGTIAGYIGIMDPVLPRGLQRDITQNDINALNLFGYNNILPSPPPNDNFASAQLLPGCSGSVTGTNVGATREAGEPNHFPSFATPGNRSVWYQWQAPSSGNVTFQTTGSNFDTVMAVYTGNTFSPAIANDDDGSTNHTSLITFNATAGTTYRIAVDGFANLSGGGDWGTINLTWNATNCSVSVQLGASSASVNEGAGTVNVAVNRSGNTGAAATVNYSTNDIFNATCSQNTGQASANCDYNTSGGTLRFAAGETSKTFPVSIINDGYVEGNETFTLTLSNPSGMSLGATTTITITINDNDATASNPFDNNAFFVRQQYLDFLLREPDSGGFNDWLNVLNNCQPNQGGLGSDPACDRVHVSSGFFRSTEFGERGYWSYRYYHAALGRRPQFAEFVPDMRRLSGFLSPAEEEAQRAAFVADFMQRAEFQGIYGSLLTANQAANFIAKLEEKAGVTLPATTTTLPGQPPQYGRAELIQKMSSGEFTAAQTLRAFIEQKVVFDAFFFRAFVAMQYFGYLLRDPEDAGYNDWVDVLTNGRGSIPPGDFRHLIFGFVWSVEYRQRFGP